MTHLCSLCHGSGVYDAGLACPYNDVHGAASRLPKPQAGIQLTSDDRSEAIVPALDLNHQGKPP